MIVNIASPDKAVQFAGVFDHIILQALEYTGRVVVEIAQFGHRSSCLWKDV